MKSAATIRTCSGIMMAIIFIGALMGGFFLCASGGLGIILGLVTGGVGIFVAIFQNAIFHGFADIIDNTYRMSYKVGADITTENLEGHEENRTI